MLEMLSSDVTQDILIVRVRWELIQGFSEIEKMSEKERMTWSNRLLCRLAYEG